MAFNRKLIFAITISPILILGGTHIVIKELIRRAHNQEGPSVPTLDTFLAQARQDKNNWIGRFAILKYADQEIPIYVVGIDRPSVINGIASNCFDFNEWNGGISHSSFPVSYCRPVERPQIRGDKRQPS